MLAVAASARGPVAGADEVRWHALTDARPFSATGVISSPIYHGRPTTAFPAVVAVGVLNRHGTAGLCTGNLIAPTAVLRAGRCLSFGPIRAAVAVFPDGVTEVDYGAGSYAVHPDFTLAVAAVADIAVRAFVKDFLRALPLEFTALMLGREGWVKLGRWI